jgi:hypothetical protein
LAEGTREPLDTLMQLLMFFQISYLRKGKTTALVITNIWLFIGVNSQMVKKVVPFPENLVASLMLTT